MKQITISTEYVTLGQFLKLANLIQTGGEAKNYLLNHQVKINGEIDNRRGRKIYAGMLVEIGEHVFKIVNE